MAFKRFVAAGLVAMLLASAFAFAAGGGTSSDPVITLSYIENKVLPQWNQRLDAEVAKAEPRLQVIYNAALGKIHAPDTSAVDINVADMRAQIEYEGYMRLLDDGVWRRANGPTRITLAAGERILVAQGGEFQLVSGSAVLAGERATEVVNVSAGALSYASLSMSIGGRYIVATGDTVAGAEAISPSVILVSGRYQVVPAARSRHTDSAFALSGIGVMKGTDKGFELERKATRLEALIMFLRLIGEEDEALAYTGSNPFTDLPTWGYGAPAKYVGYAYSKGYTNGISTTKFGANDEVTVEMYMTFLLRALGYSEAAGDFNWVNAPRDAVRLGVITEYEHRSIARRTFIRDTMAYLSWRALEARCKNGMILSTRLINDGAFTQRQYASSQQSGVRRLG